MYNCTLVQNCPMYMQAWGRGAIGLTTWLWFVAVAKLQPWHAQPPVLCRRKLTCGLEHKYNAHMHNRALLHVSESMYDRLNTLLPKESSNVWSILPCGLSFLYQSQIKPIWHLFHEILDTLRKLWNKPIWHIFHEILKSLRKLWSPRSADSPSTRSATW